LRLFYLRRLFFIHDNGFPPFGNRHFFGFSIIFKYIMEKAVFNRRKLLIIILRTNRYFTEIIRQKNAGEQGRKSNARTK